MLAFTRGATAAGSVYVVNVDGSDERNGDARPGARRFAWSPDGRRIAFDSARDGNSEIYVVNSDGGGLQRLTRNAGPDLAPAWSPDGRRIAFAGSRGIHVMNADGSGQRNLMRKPPRDFAPTWSPDGRRIAFGSLRDGNAEVYVMNADGSGQRNLTRSPWNEGSASGRPERDSGRCDTDLDDRAGSVGRAGSAGRRRDGSGYRTRMPNGTSTSIPQRRTSCSAPGLPITLAALSAPLEGARHSRTPWPAPACSRSKWSGW